MELQKPSSKDAAYSSENACPYAIALHPPVDDSDHEQEDLGDALRTCPAFAAGSCPFKDAKSAEEVRETLKKIPPSHFDQQGKFYQVIQELHHVKATPDNDKYHLAGGCPVQSVVKEKVQSFTEALERMSLSAIMAQIAEAEEDKLEQMKLSLGFEKSDVAAAGTQDVALEKAIDDDDNETRNDKSSNERQMTGTSSPRVSLSESLKTGTAVSHQAAEDVHFVNNFVKGKIDRTLYAQMVVMLYHVYDALEDCLEQYAPSTFPTCHFPRELNRKQALREDVDFWHGDNNKDVVEKPSPATRDYMDRIRYVAKHDPLLLLAHSYTRYLGDLSGGRILARVARKAMNLGSEGLEFYEFQNIDSPKKFKDMYRQALDALPLTPEQIHKVVAEANVAFCLNIRLFEELDVMANVPGAVVRPLSEALAYANMDPSAAAGKGECPFLVAKPVKGGDTVVAEGASKQQQRCPWPFIFAHDARQGLRDWQTWLVVGLALSWAWQKYLQSSTTSQSS